MPALPPPRAPLGSRRETNTLRRHGTGRATTKRSFTFKLPTLAPVHGLIGRKTGLALKRSVEQDKHNLDDVTHFWRDSLEGNMPVADHEAHREQTEGGDATSINNCQTRASIGAPTPNADAASPRVPALASASHESSDIPSPYPNAEVQLPISENAPLLARAEAAPTPFRRANRLQRTPAGPKGPGVDNATNEDSPRVPGALSFTAERSSDMEVEQEGVVEETAVLTEAHAHRPPEVQRHSMATSPMGPEATGQAEVAPVAQHNAVRKSIGTSPMHTSLEAVAGIDDHPPDNTLPVPSTPDASEQSDFPAGQTPAVRDDDLNYEPGSGPTLREPERFDSVGIPTFADDDDDADFGGGFDDADEDVGFAADRPDEVVEPQMPQDPAPPRTSRSKEKAVTSRTSRKTGGATRKTRKTSLDKIGRLPEAMLTREALEPEQSRRAGKRQRFRPLEYWRGERVVYGRRASAKFEAIVDVQVLEAEPTPPHFRRMRRRANASLKVNNSCPNEEGDVAAACAQA
ncbi:hypothetical protein AB1Y20_009899 [Prymnesium parvum]|uniref:Uncharacterized protein n=1 Tax=Prymnesium parvum TaxID=97485 RepID=A0AB34K6Q5_PRYPA